MQLPELWKHVLSIIASDPAIRIQLIVIFDF